MELTPPPPEPLPTHPLPDMGGHTVLQVLPRLETGGVERGTIEMVRAIVEAGGKAWVASEGGRLEEQIIEAGGRHETLPLASKNPWRVYQNAAALTALIEREQIGLVHARSRAPAWSALWATRRLGTPFVTTYHGLYSENLPFKRLYNRVMADGDRVIAISQVVADHIEAIYAVPEDRLRLIPRGVDLEQFDPDAEDLPDRVETLAQRWEIPDTEERPFLILLPARLTRWKGHQLLLEAVSRLPEPAMVLMVGGGDLEYQRELIDYAKTLDLSSMVRFAGNCSDMPAAYALADLVVTPSQRPEAFGRTVIEAQAMNRLIVATNHGGALETIEPDVTGWLVPPGDAEQLAVTIESIMAMSPEDRDLAAGRARRMVERQFSTSKMQASTLSVYLELLTAQPEQPPEPTDQTDQA